jgi:hypothetical protein
VKFSRHNLFEQKGGMGTVSANVPPFPGQGADAWIEAYKEEVLAAKDAATIEAYIRILE